MSSDSMLHQPGAAGPAAASHDGGPDSPHSPYAPHPPHPPHSPPSSRAPQSPQRLSSPRLNRLLAALPQAVLERWWPALEPVTLVLGQVLYESGVPLTHVYFPTTAIVSLLHLTREGGSTEVAVVGNEGLIGMPVLMGGTSTPGRAVVQFAGCAYRITGPALIDEVSRPGPALGLLMRYAQALIAHMAQTAVCNRHHTLDQQLCRWLLLNLDRVQGPDLIATQEQIANMLGVRREGVTEAAVALQREQLISYRRGLITVLSRPGLEQRTCECYAVVKAEYDRLLPAQSTAS